MFKKLFGKEEKKKAGSKGITVTAPSAGRNIPLEQVPDPVFSQKMLGDGMAVEPSEGIVVSPVDGRIIQVFPTKHAVGILAENGAEILIHVGLETVALKGEGFQAFINEGDTVTTGQKLLAFDLDIIREKAKSTVIPVIVTNGASAELFKTEEQTAAAGESVLFTVTMKD